MANRVLFNGRSYVLPTVASRILSGRTNAIAGLDSGGVLLIDTGVGAGWGFGKGFNSEVEPGAGNIYRFRSLNDFRDSMKGGRLWLAASKLFAPGGGAAGVSYIDYVRAATTTRSTITTTIGTVVLTFNTIEEGLVTVGQTGTPTTGLSKGYGLRIDKDLRDSTKFRLIFYIGTWRGSYSAVEGSNSLDIGGITREESQPQVLFELGDITTAADIVARFSQVPAAREFFTLSTTAEAAALAAANTFTITPENTYELAAGGTETRSPEDLTTTLTAVASSETNFILCDQFGAESRNANNTAIVNYPFNHTKSIWIGGDSGREGVALTISTAAQYNNEKVRLVFGNYREQLTTVNGVETFDSFLKACILVGIAAGLQPQQPIKFRPVSFQSNVYEPTIQEQEDLTQGGVNYVYFDDDLRRLACSIGVNTLQFPNNRFNVNDDGSSFNDQIVRIKNNLNKGLSIGAKRDLLANTQGANINTVSDADVIAWTEAFLRSRTATTIVDAEIIAFSNVQVTRTDSTIFVSYELTINEEVDKIFFTGFII